MSDWVNLGIHPGSVASTKAVPPAPRVQKFWEEASVQWSRYDDEGPWPSCKNRKSKVQKSKCWWVVEPTHLKNYFIVKFEKSSPHFRGEHIKIFENHHLESL